MARFFLQLRSCMTAIACGSIFWGALSHQAHAARPVWSPRVVTEVSQTGRDFDYQGEYVGTVTGGYRPAPVGLQVIAMGDDQLSAVVYPGGLPGCGWNGEPTNRMTGRWNGTMGMLSGDQTSVNIVLSRHEVWVRDAKGAFRGMIHRVHRASPNVGAPPAPGAIVLFNGTDTSQFKGGRMTSDGLLMEGAATRDSFQDFVMHVEFRTPYMPAARGQGRGNSGIYIQGRYEVQILDSFGLEGLANECGGLYRQRPPDVNMCLPPLTWQAYDIAFRAPRFDAQGNKIENARITLCHNGVLVHNNVEIIAKTGAGQPEGPNPRPILFQNHSNPVRFRNIWIVPYLTDYHPTCPSGPRSYCPPLAYWPDKRPDGVELITAGIGPAGHSFANGN